MTLIIIISTLVTLIQIFAVTSVLSLDITDYKPFNISPQIWRLTLFFNTIVLLLLYISLLMVLYDVKQEPRIQQYEPVHEQFYKLKQP